MKPLYLLFFILNLLNISAQNLDSLKLVADKLPHDTDRVNLFYDEGFSHRTIDAQYSYDCARQAENFAQKTSEPFYTAKAFNLLGILFYRKGDLNTALSFHKKALKLRMFINDKKGIALSQANLGNIYSDLARYKSAEDSYLKALEINNELNLPKQIDNCLLNLGVLSVELKAVNIAESYFLRALKNAEKRFDYETQASCLNNLAYVNIRKQNYDAAIANCTNSIKIKDIMENEMEKADSYLNIAAAYINKKEGLHALENLIIADSIILKFNYLAAKIDALKTYSEYYKLSNDYEKAFANLQRANVLTDSLAKENKKIDENNFIETSADETPEETKKTGFPFLLFGILLFLALACAVLIFKNKR
ncbi:MAG: tetratricopeptide repeat protein [Bacteroidetes bacterium]|nr:tetratricopeptide repeat protein [Bacteroidota bacterium]